MVVKEFEQAAKDMGAEMLRVVYDAKGGRQVKKCFAQIGLTYIKWDEMGRAYVFTISEGQEDCTSEYNLEYLPYERDSKFDVEV